VFHKYKEYTLILEIVEKVPSVYKEWFNKDYIDL